MSHRQSVEPIESSRAKFEAAESELLREISRTPRIISLLYDLDLLPEQITKPSKDWQRMLLIAEHVRYWNTHIDQKDLDALDKDGRAGS